MFKRCIISHFHRISRYNTTRVRTTPQQAPAPVGFARRPCLRPWTSRGRRCRGRALAPSCTPSSCPPRRCTDTARPGGRRYICNSEPRSVSHCSLFQGLKSIQIQALHDVPGFRADCSVSFNSNLRPNSSGDTNVLVLDDIRDFKIKPTVALTKRSGAFLPDCG